ncbi:MAG: NAD-binding oxidoreductase, partial [Lachnospiraceae bacterium]|nr:NAD-binding oxidoreductase [Lachnospiraceae bacterium]
MYKILKKQELAANIILMDVEAERVAKSCLPGQFVIVRVDEEGERVPLTICDYDADKGIITIVFQVVGASTKKMAGLGVGEGFATVVGPLGCPSDLTKEPLEELRKKSIVFIAGGVGTAPVYPQVKWLKEHGVDADVI